MKKALCMALCAIVAGGVGLHAQKRTPIEKHWSLGLDAGLIVSLNENSFSYARNHQVGGLLTLHKGIQAGYDFTAPFGIRASLAWDRNAGACNVQETGNKQGFYPYKFSSLNGFVDFMLGFRKSEKTLFCPKLYLGIGGAYTFNYTDSGHPWQKVDDPSGAFGMRLGAIFEWRLSPVIGLQLDLCGEAYTDHYNGLEPNKGDQSKVEGYAGFPLDLRGIASVGILFYL